MTQPIVFISHFRVKPGMMEEFHTHYLSSIPVTLADKPSTLVQLGFIDEGANEFSVVRVFPDAEAMDQQLQGSDDRTKITYQFIEPIAMEIYGTPGNYSMELIQKAAGKGIKITMLPLGFGGFIRGVGQ